MTQSVKRPFKIGVSMPKDVGECLVLQAEIERRSKANLIEKALVIYLEAKGYNL